MAVFINLAVNLICCYIVFAICTGNSFSNKNYQALRSYFVVIFLVVRAEQLNQGRETALPLSGKYVTKPKF